MKLAATVVIPTHNHGLLLHYSLESVLAQTLDAIEIFVIGDGVLEETRSLVARFMQRDRRIKFFDFPKGPRLGEVYRHELLMQHAQGEIICYHADDDLMLPNHIVTVKAALLTADFVHTLPIMIRADSTLEVLTLDLAIPAFYQSILHECNRIPLVTAAHTRQFYRSLPFGWRTTPEGIPTDHYMWQQILAQPSCRAASIPKPTVLHFPSPWRSDWTIDQRIEELQYWQHKLARPEGYTELLQTVQEACLEKAIHLESSLFQQQTQLSAVNSQIEQQKTQLLAAHSQMEHQQNTMNILKNGIIAMQNTLVWRIGERLRRYFFLSKSIKLLRKLKRYFS